MNFREFIESDRENRNKEKFEGTFLDYLDIVKNNPDVAKLAHKRIQDMIISKGIKVLKGEENARIRKKNRPTPRRSPRSRKSSPASAAKRWMWTASPPR